MADKLMYIPHDGTQNFPFCRLKLMVKTIEHSTLLTNQSNSPKVVNPMIKKRLKLWVLV